MTTISAVFVVVQPDEKKAKICDWFLMADDAEKTIADMNDEEILDALQLATKVGAALERRGYTVGY